MTSSSTVEILLSRNGEKIHLRTMKEEIIVKGSRTICNAIEGQIGTEKTVTISGASAGPLKAILDRIEQQRSDLYIKVHKFESIEEGIMVWQACQALDVQPEQPKIEGWIVQEVAHQKITPNGMLAITRAFTRNSRASTTMIHQLGWDLVHKKYTSEEATALQAMAKTIPELHVAVLDKIKELEKKRGWWVERKLKEADGQGAGDAEQAGER